MNESIFWGGSVLAAVVAGTIALFAPCCISVMLPAYFASSFPNRGLLMAMTFLFAAGVATIILPIAMGANYLRSLIATEHTTIYAAAGLVMIGLAGYLLLGGQLHLPALKRGTSGRTGPLRIYALGVFSGVATSCCAPVLAGVIALSGAASSFGFPLVLGIAYVFGMVAPLLAISLLWDRRDWRASHLFAHRPFTWRLGHIRRTLSAANLASSLLLLAMGGWMLWAGFTVDDLTPLTRLAALAIEPGPALWPGRDKPTSLAARVGGDCPPDSGYRLHDTPRHAASRMDRQ